MNTYTWFFAKCIHIYIRYMIFWSGILERFVLYWLFIMLTGSKYQFQNYESEFRIKTSFQLLFFLLLFKLKTIWRLKTSWKFQIRSFGIGSWIWWARYVYGIDTFMIWKITTTFFPLLFLSLNFSLFHDKIVVRVIRLRSAEQTANGKIFFQKSPIIVQETQIFVQKPQKTFFYITTLFVHFPRGFKDKNLKLNLPPTYLPIKL